MQQPSTSGRVARLALPLTMALALGGAAVVIWQLDRRVEELTVAAGANDAILQQILGEVTRVRLEQRSEALGPQGLLKKLQTYAPMLTSARVPEPDYKQAKREMDAILLAFGAIGPDAWSAITTRLRDLNGDKDFEEVRWLLRAAVKVDPKAGKELVKDVLTGTRLPAPRLRLDMARLMTEIDQPLAQVLLRQILTTESSRGVNTERAALQGSPIPDAAALAASGFHNFVTHYVDTQDPKIDETLLMVMGRAEHDLQTVQKCVETLGRRRSERAVPAIEKLYHNPPNRQENPLFLIHCLTALHEIQGPAARPFLEAALQTAPTDLVANHCKRLLGQPVANLPQAENSIAPPGKK